MTHEAQKSPTVRQGVAVGVAQTGAAPRRRIPASAHRLGCIAFGPSATNAYIAAAAPAERRLP